MQFDGALDCFIEKQLSKNNPIFNLNIGFNIYRFKSTNRLKDLPIKLHESQNNSSYRFVITQTDY